MTEQEARAICKELGATLSIRRRGKAHYLYVSRWLPGDESGHKANKDSGGQISDRYVCARKKLNDLDEKTLRLRIAALQTNPNAQKRKSRMRTQAFFDLLHTLPGERTSMKVWADDAEKALRIPLEQLIYRLAFYRSELEREGLRLAQSTRHNMLYVPIMGKDDGAYYSHIWRET